MKISTRIRYGLRTMLEIAQHHSTKGVLQKDIANKQALSNKYLDHIVHGLKTSGLIINVKGKKSGYRLTRNPSEITVLDVYYALEPNLCLVECLSCDVVCERQPACLTQGLWKQLNNLIVNYFRSITLEDLLLKRISLTDFQENPSPVQVLNI